MSVDTQFTPRVDPVTGAVIPRALENLAMYKPMGMAYSSIIREGEDFGAAPTTAHHLAIGALSPSSRGIVDAMDARTGGGEPTATVAPSLR
ncbi:MAG: hypothetical protein ACFCBW_09670 [Candidatus Competibacterales bacterium]